MGGCLSRTEVSEVEAVAVTPRRKSSRTGRGANRSNRGQSYVVRTYTPPPPPPIFGCEGEYKVMELLGTGGTGQTWLCQHHETARRVAVKFVPRPLPPVLVPLISMELQLQAGLSEGHVGLVRLESAMLSRTHLGLVMEYVDGGTLTQYVSKRTETRDDRGGLNLTEDEARYMFRQLVSAVEHLHSSHVAHRDLKMCNVVLSSSYPPVLKLCDFGFAKNFNNEDSKMHTCIGTPVYMSPNQLAAAAATKKAPPPPTPFPGKAPELPAPVPEPAPAPAPAPEAGAASGDLSDSTPVLSYSARAADVWACGVMLFAMLLGRFPFDHENHPDPNSSDAQVEVWKEQVRASGEDWQKMPRVAPYVRLLSDSCRDLLGKMLQFEEADRINVTGIKQHPWYNMPLPEHLDKTLTEMEGRQLRQTQRLAKVTPEQLAARDAAIKDLVLRASRVPGQQRANGGTGPRRPPPLSILNPGLFAAIQEADRESDSPRTPGMGTPTGDGSQTPRRRGVTFAETSVPDSERPTGPPCSEAPVSSAQVEVATDGAANEADADEGSAAEPGDNGKLLLLDLSSAAWAAKQLAPPQEPEPELVVQAHAATPAAADAADPAAGGAADGADAAAASAATATAPPPAVASAAGAVAEAVIAEAGTSHAPSSTACGSPAAAASLAASTATSLLTNNSSTMLCAPAGNGGAHTAHNATAAELSAAVDAAVAAVAAAAEQEVAEKAQGFQRPDASTKVVLSNRDGHASAGSTQAPCTPDGSTDAAVNVSA